MIYSEATFFGGYHFHHIAAFVEKRREDRRVAAFQEHYERNRRVGFGRRLADQEVTSA
jgi:hypothetical protein